ncbi:MAG TPA: hypothetical protein VLC93_15860 [Myxococcota bacterium]|nr:hypothetical protein [Myxococcota bacterium]
MTVIAPRPPIAPTVAERVLAELDKKASDATMRVVTPSIKASICYMAPAFAADLAVRALAHTQDPLPFAALAGVVAAIGLGLAIPQTLAAYRAAKELVADVRDGSLRSKIACEATALQAFIMGTPPVALLVGSIAGSPAALATAAVGGLFAGYLARLTKDTKWSHLAVETGPAMVAAAVEKS